MKLQNPKADILVPDGAELSAALSRTTHLGLGAHQDDLEIALPHGILECFGRRDRWFTGVTCTDGAGSARTGVYADYSNEEMSRVRMVEQRAAAHVGRYSAMLQLGYSSKQVKDAEFRGLEDDLVAILTAARPRVVYTHNPADKHATHVAVFRAVLRALRRLPPAARPERVLGCEAWRGLDWLPDNRKVVLDLTANASLLASLLGVFHSQVAGGKRYDLATLGRFRSNATFLESHAIDTSEVAVYAMDLTPLIQNDQLDPQSYVTGLIDEFRGQACTALQ